MRKKRHLLFNYSEEQQSYGKKLFITGVFSGTERKKHYFLDKVNNHYRYHVGKSGKKKLSTCKNIYLFVGKSSGSMTGG